LQAGQTATVARWGLAASRRNALTVLRTRESIQSSRPRTLENHGTWGYTILTITVPASLSLARGSIPRSHSVPGPKASAGQRGRGCFVQPIPSDLLSPYLHSLHSYRVVTCHFTSHLASCISNSADKDHGATQPHTLRSSTSMSQKGDACLILAPRPRRIASQHQAWKDNVSH
jgi:hypothetical protein